MNTLFDLFHLGIVPARKTVRVLGIDLGTTNSLVAGLTWDSSSPADVRTEILRLAQTTIRGDSHNFLVPSIVAIHEGNIVVGDGAKLLRTRPEAGLLRDSTIFWDTKNEIGEDIEYPAEMEELSSPVGVASEILKFIMRSIPDEWRKYDCLVISTPASFSSLQREDTIEAAKLAGIRLDRSNLIDEPLAALISWIADNPRDHLPLLGNQRTHLLVFDFGGGTCDVAICRISFPKGRLHLQPVTVSRYCQFGGSDIDRAIASKALIPQFEKQNSVDWGALPFSTRSGVLDFLSDHAEKLKIKLSKEIRSKDSFDVEKTVLESLVVRLAGQYQYKDTDNVFRLREPVLSYAQYIDALKPMLAHTAEASAVENLDSDHRIFAPIESALIRAGLNASDITHVLLAGGSSLHVPVRDALESYFSSSRVLAAGSPDEMQRVIARGAAIQAWSLAAYDQSAIPTVCLQPRSLLTLQGRFPLSMIEDPLPLAKVTDDELGIPEDIAVGETWPMRVEVVDETGEHRIFSQTWTITGPLRKGTPLRLEARMTLDQILELTLAVAGNKPFHGTIERPQSAVQVRWQRRAAKVYSTVANDNSLPSDERISACLTAIDALRSSNARPEAIALASRAADSFGAESPHLWSSLGMLYSDSGDHRSSLEAHTRAAELDSREFRHLFNQAISFRRLEKYEEARRAMETAVTMAGDKVSSAHLMLTAVLCDDLKDSDSAESFAERALTLLPPLSEATDWLLKWALWFSCNRKDSDLEQKVRAEQARRHRGASAASGGFPMELAR